MTASHAGRDYTPPTSATMRERQNHADALRLLIAQRRIYNVAKRWQSARWVGVMIIGIAAPVLAIIVPQAAVVVGAVAGAWLFFGRTAFAWGETLKMGRAAAVQEDFDRYVFAMPVTIARTTAPTREDIAAIAGDRAQTLTIARREKLLDWYPISLGASGATSVAVSQRANAAYSDRLLRATVAVWASASLGWALLMTIVSLAAGLSLGTFLVGVLLPVLPACLDAFEYIRSTFLAARDRRDLAATIESRLLTGAAPVDGQELLVWQERIYELRQTTPQILNWLYRLLRPSNEAAMHAAAEDLTRGRSDEEDV